MGNINISDDTAKRKNNSREDITDRKYNQNRGSRQINNLLNTITIYISLYIYNKLDYFDYSSEFN